MPSSGFEPTISASERPQAYILDRAVTGIGVIQSSCHDFFWKGSWVA